MLNERDTAPAPRVPTVNPEHATGKTRKLLDMVQVELGMVPNFIRTLANSSTVLEAYLNFEATLARGTLSADLRERIALTVAETNQSTYCLAAHAAIAKTVGLSDQDIQDCREGTSPIRRVDAALAFSQRLITMRGAVSDDDIARLRSEEYRESEIAEIVALVALNTLTNYATNLAGTEIDYPNVGRTSRRQAPLKDGVGTK